jgi:Flp pilus assembly pilin Flp
MKKTGPSPQGPPEEPMSRMLCGFVADESGQDLIEYALLVSLLTVVSIAALKLLGARVSKAFAQVNTAL